MPIFQGGTLNTAALVVPDTYVQILSPTLQLINGVPTNVVGFVGSAAWGPVGVPTDVGSFPDYVRRFGPLQARRHDMGTAVAVAVQQGANVFKCVRVTDGTDTAASATIGTNALSVTSKYTGTGGQAISVSLSPGSKAGSWRATVTMAGSGLAPEVFDNITGTGNPLWLAIAAAINNGVPGQRSASELVVATAGASSSTPTAAITPLTGGADGAAGLTQAHLLGLDSGARTGMYALRGTGASVVSLVDADTPAATWAAQVAFGLAEGAYMMLAGPAGETIASAATAKATAGIDTRTAKVIVGDHVMWSDPTLGINRLVSPAAFAAGMLGNLAPHQSSLNKPLGAVVGTQRSATNAPYSAADLQAAALAGLDLIANPSPGGGYFSFRFGRNASSNPAERGDNHTRMTNFLASTLNGGMGRYIGLPIDERQLSRIEGTLDTFLADLKRQGMIEDHSAICRARNNPPSRTALGYVQADVKVRYLAITEFLVVNLEGGQAVTVQRLAEAA